MSGYAITGATLIDGLSRAPVKDATIVIEGSRIREVSQGRRVKIPRGAKTVDGRGRFIIPGLADMHNHLGKGGFGPTQGPPDYKKNLAQLLAWVVTTIFDPGIPSLTAFDELKSVSTGDT